MYSDPSFITQRLSYAVSVIGFGADPDGIEDSGPAFAAAIAECRERNYSTLHIPAGKYVIKTINTIGNPYPCVDATTTPNAGWCLSYLSGLCIRGDGAIREGSGDQTGTTIIFELPSPSAAQPVVGIGIKGSSGLRFENLTIQGSPSSTPRPYDMIGVYIDTVDGASTTGIIFQNVTFRWCQVAVQTSTSNNNSELSFFDCDFTGNVVGFQSLKDQALVQKFIGCTGGGDPSLANEATFWSMEAMFDLTSGGNVTVVGFGGQNIETFVKVGDGGGNIGWNLFHNVRLEQVGDGTSTWGETYRTILYDAVMSGSSMSPHGQRTQFDGVVITPPASGTPASGTPRIKLLSGHTVVLRNASRSTYPLATASSKLLEFRTSGGDPGGVLRCFNVTVDFDARLDRAAVPQYGRYSFEECVDEENVPYPDLLHPPLYGPNYLMSLEYHCWAKDDALNGVVEDASPGGNSVVDVTPDTGDTDRFGVLGCRTTVNGHAALVSDLSALRPGGGTWRFQSSARSTASSEDPLGSEFEVRLGFGDDAAGEPDNGVYFRYRHTLNSDEWEGVVRWGGTSVDVLDTNKAFDTSWHTFEIEFDGDTATFYMDGERLGTASADRSGAGPTGLMPLQFVRLGGSGTKSAEIDYYKYEIRPDVAQVGQMFPE